MTVELKTDQKSRSDRSETKEAALPRLAKEWLVARHALGLAASAKRKATWRQWDIELAMYAAAKAKDETTTLKVVAQAICDACGGGDLPISVSSLQEHVATARSIPPEKRAEGVSPNTYRHFVRIAKRHPDADGDPIALVHRWVEEFSRSRMPRYRFTAAREQEANKASPKKKPTTTAKKKPESILAKPERARSIAAAMQ